MKLSDRFRNIILAASVLINMSAGAQVVDYGKEHGVLSFEESTAPAVASKGSAAAISEKHAKLGTHSLKWEWKQKNAVLSFPGDVLYLPENPNPKETSVSSFVFWVYSPEVMKGNLRISFLKKGRECCHFNYGLGFQGWRGAWVAFDRDMKGKPEEGMDEVRISAPKGVKQGCLYFDGVIPASFQDVRYHTPDWQAPFVNEKTTVHWLVLNNSWKLTLDVPQKARLDDADIRDMKAVKDRFIEISTEKVKPVTPDEAQKIYDSYNISYNEDGTIKGKPIWFIRYGETFLNLGIPDAKKTFRKYGQLLSTYNDDLLRIAISAVKAEEGSVEKELFTRIYLDMTRHLLDQGFAAGSAQGTLHHLGYSMKNYYTSPVLMRDALVKAGLAEQVQQAMEWFSGVGEVKVKPTGPGMDIDAFNTSLMGRVASVLMLEDTPYKHAYMQAISRWIDNGLKHTEGLRPCFKRDGTVVHHRKAYPAYAVGGFKGAVNAVWMLAGTGLAVSQESHSNLKEALLAMQFYSYRELFPLAMSGRHPDGKWSLNKEQYYRLALAGSPDKKDKLDKDLAYAYITLLRDHERGDGHMTSANEVPTKKEKYLEDNGINIRDIRRPTGTRTFGFNCSMSHRYEGRLVTIAGHSRYLWAAEIYQNANHYGRYLTHGSMQILAPEEPGRVGGGFYQPGWDWCHIPGTTAAVLPMHEMKSNVLNVDKYSGYEEMLLSDEWFAGGVTHNGKNGAYAMKLHEHDKYNGSLRARKSFFTFQNRIICLGTDIENSLKDAPVHTTLFQNYVGNAPSWEPMPVEGRSDILRDHSSALYFVNGGKIHFSVGLQHSLHEESDAPTEGHFEKAYIDHGDILKGGEYEYMVYMPAKDDIFCQTGMDADAIAKYAADLPYKVLRKETDIHGVLDIPSGIKAFAVFEQGDVDETILECSPAMVMYSVEDGTMTLSVSNPDLALYEGPSDEIFDQNGKRIERSIYSRKWVNNPCADTKVHMTLNGLWQIEDAAGVRIAARHDNGNTVLEFTSKEARTEEVTLKKID